MKTTIYKNARRCWVWIAERKGDKYAAQNQGFLTKYECWKDLEDFLKNDLNISEKELKKIKRKLK